MDTAEALDAVPQLAHVAHADGVAIAPLDGVVARPRADRHLDDVLDRADRHPVARGSRAVDGDLEVRAADDAVGDHCDGSTLGTSFRMRSSSKPTCSMVFSPAL